MCVNRGHYDGAWSPCSGQRTEERLSNASGDGTKPLKDVLLATMGHMKLEIIGDPSLILRGGPCAPDATIGPTGKVEKPGGWQPSVVEGRVHVKNFVGVTCSVDVAAEGGATCAGLGRLRDELRERCLVGTGPGGKATSRFILV
jgi:hypothetical protein